MSFFVYRKPGSNGAAELADALGGVRLRAYDNGRFFRSSRNRNLAATIRPGDVVVNWGSGLVQLPAGVKGLNNSAINSKFTDAEKLAAAGVPTVEVSRQRPVRAAAAPAVDPALAIHAELAEGLEDLQEAPVARTPVYIDGLRQLETRIQRLRDALQRAIPPGRPAAADADWVGRVNDHTGGTDLLTPPPNPDYYVKKLDLLEEYRVHSFCGKSIRAGVKKVRAGFNNPSPWIRSYDGGWSISYDDFKSTKEMRDLADKAVKALGLDFGAVDLGKTRDGHLIVLELNRCPGLEGGTVTAYQTAITSWAADAAAWQAPRARRDGRRRAA